MWPDIMRGHQTISEEQQAKREAVKHEVLGGEHAAALWSDALNALHRYAHASKCPPGKSVVAWFDERITAYEAALRAARRDAS